MLDPNVATLVHFVPRRSPEDPYSPDPCQAAVIATNVEGQMDLDVFAATGLTRIVGVRYDAAGEGRVPDSWHYPHECPQTTV